MSRRSALPHHARDDRLSKALDRVPQPGSGSESMTSIELIPRSRPGGVPVGPELLERVGFTDHAITRFAQRAELASSSRAVIEPIVRDLLLDEGRVVSAPPPWARSRNSADLLLQLGNWMLLIGCHDPLRAGHYSIVTAVNGQAGDNWGKAKRRGYISTPPPRVVRWRPSLLISIARGLAARRPEEAPFAAVRRVHRVRCRLAEMAHDRAILDNWRKRR